MKREEILDVIIDVVRQMQEQSGREVPDLDGDTHLIGDVPGCDSLILVELAMLLTEALVDALDEREIPDSLFAGLEADKHPTLNEIAANIESFLAGVKAPRSGSKTPAKTISLPSVGQPHHSTAPSSPQPLKLKKLVMNSAKPLPSLHDKQLLEENEDEHNIR